VPRRWVGLVVSPVRKEPAFTLPGLDACGEGDERSPSSPLLAIF
jgi:hypothetical protein